ncbi:MAG: arginase family protein [Anaerolineae bacterium]|nr:arginase family protein [Anaerolineae bacterium]
MAKLVIITVPYWLGEKTEYSGSVEAALEANIAEQIGAQVVQIAPQFSADEEAVVSVNRALAQAIHDHADSVPLILAGDCTSCWGAVTGLLQRERDLHVMWYDAHGDFNTPETSPSGFLGGMPLAAMVGKGNQERVHAIGLRRPIEENRITLVDGRDLDPEEAQMLEDSFVHQLPSVSDVQSRTWEFMPMYIHFDGDVLNLEDNPAVGYPAAGGPSLAESIESVQHVIRNSEVKGVLFTLWDQRKPGAEQSRESLLSVIRAAAEALQA